MRRSSKVRVMAVLGAMLALFAVFGSASALTNSPEQSAAPPWMAMLTENGQETCSGAVVGNGWVLTAAHCVYNNRFTPGKIRVHVGSIRPNDRQGAEYSVAFIVPMPGFDTKLRMASGSTPDAALVKIENFDENRWHALPIAFQPSIVRATDGITIYGYGYNRNGGDNGILRKSPDGAFVVTPDCYGQVVCLHYTSKNAKVVGGDSGAPWLRWVSGAWQIIAVDSGVVENNESHPAFGTAAVPTSGASLVEWVHNAAGLPNEPSGTIVRNKNTGSSWLVGSDGYRHWIPTGGDYLCFTSHGSKVANLPQVSIDTIPDQVGSRATCARGGSGGAPGQPAPTSPPAAVPDQINGFLYRLEGDSRVNVVMQQPDGRFKAFWVGGDTVLSCLEQVQGKQVVVVPASAAQSITSRVSVVNEPAACAFPGNWVLSGPGGREQWRIEGDNSSNPYVRRYYESALTVYLNTGGHPEYRTLSSVAAINGVQRGPDMPNPEGAYFVNDANGDAFRYSGNQFHKVPNPDTMRCLGNPDVTHVPGDVVGNLSQGSPIACNYEGRIIYGPDQHQYYVVGSQRYPITNITVSACIQRDNKTGSPVAVSDSTIGDYARNPRALDAHCPYETRHWHFVTETGSHGFVWLVEIDPSGRAIKRHAGALCPNPTGRNELAVHEVPLNEVAGHIQGDDWFPSTAACAALLN